MGNTQIPTPQAPFTGVINRLANDSTPAKSSIVKPPATAPNIVVVLLDDVGFGAPGTFGGPIPTPALDRVAAQGVIYNQFHTTAMCSPTRAALLTGRNHHSAHFGGIAEIAYGFPGYDCVIPNETAMVSETLRMNGYSTGMFGKWHLTPVWETGPNGPFDHWPTGMGFEHFYGFLGAETSQWEPALYEGTKPIEPYFGREDYHLTEDLTDNCISWIRNQKAAAPDKPFFAYYAPGATHSPHHVWPEWIEKFTGTFDEGWDRLRVEIYERQLEMGIIPPETKLTPRPEQVIGWDEYPDRYKPVARRLMEVYAGFLAHTDAQIGRLIDALVELEQWDNTLFIYVTGDNGASAEGTVHGAWSAPSFQNGFPEDPEWLLANMDDFGSARCENHFNVGWAWGLDSPFQWMKQVASHFGGTRNGLAISWPKGIAASGELRSQFHHVIDIVPTILEVAQIPAPESVNGIEQRPIEGVSMQYSFDDQEAPSTRTTQYFEILGNRGVYHQGWIASCFHGRVPWVRSGARAFDGEQESWELYKISDDFSQADDLASEFPEKLAELRAIFDVEAKKYLVYPLSDETLTRALPANRPSFIDGVSKVVFYPGAVRFPELATINMKNTSFQILAHLQIPEQGADGVVICQGGVMAGWALTVTDSYPQFCYNYFGRDITLIDATAPLPSGAVELLVDFHYDGGGLGKGGEIRISINGSEVGRGRIEKTVPFLFSMSGETLDVGLCTGTSVGPVTGRAPFTGEIEMVTMEVQPNFSAQDSADLAVGRARVADGLQ